MTRYHAHDPAARKRRQDWTIVRDAVLWLLLIFAACVLWPVPG